MATSPTNKKDAAPFQDSASQCGGATGTRTPDPLLAKQMLSQLSYRPWRMPPAYYSRPREAVQAIVKPASIDPLHHRKRTLPGG